MGLVLNWCISCMCVVVIGLVVEHRSKVFVCTLFKRCIPSWGGIIGVYWEYGVESRADIVFINQLKYIGRCKAQVFIRS
jgi:hypothetical protein